MKYAEYIYVNGNLVELSKASALNQFAYFDGPIALAVIVAVFGTLAAGVAYVLYKEFKE